MKHWLLNDTYKLRYNKYEETNKLRKRWMTMTKQISGNSFNLINNEEQSKDVTE